MLTGSVERFKKLCLVNIAAVYILILAGGVVRTTGSGMGCPDWPKCFGSWAPPTSADQLPSNYKSIYAASREKKNLKFAKYLKALGFSKTADQIATDKSIQTETDFNVTKAWIEYGNRVIAVILGFLNVALFWSARHFRKTDPAIFYLSLATLMTIILQGWFGSIVVSTNLTTWTITVHMFIALLVVFFLVRLLSLVSPSIKQQTDISTTRLILVACIGALLIQILLGTKVRSGIDALAGLLPRAEWISSLGTNFLIHRSFSIVVALLHVILFVKLAKIDGPKALPRALIMIILGALLTGVGMAWWAVPALLQPLHLLLATSAVGIQFFLFFQWRPLTTQANPGI